MNPKHMYEKVKTSPVFDNYGYLAHFFCMLDKNFEPIESWQIGLYNKEEDKIKSYKIDSEIIKGDAAEVFKKPDTIVEELNLDSVKINFKSACEIAKNIQEKNYNQYQILKIVCLLQCVNEKNIWNFTFVPAQLKTINIKINSLDGTIDYSGVIEFFNKS